MDLRVSIVISDSKNRNVTRQHCNKEHGLRQKKDDELLTRVRLQTWFQDHREHYWIVDDSKVGQGQGMAAVAVPGEEGSSVEDTETKQAAGEGLKKSDSEFIMQQLQNNYNDWDKALQERRLQLSKDIPPQEHDNWLHFTRWNPILSASTHNLAKTYDYTQKPDAKKEPELERVLEAWHCIVQRCLESLEDVDNTDLLKWLQSPRQEEPAGRPFRLPQTGHTVNKYEGLWSHFLCYVFDLRHATRQRGQRPGSSIQ